MYLMFCILHLFIFHGANRIDGGAPQGGFYCGFAAIHLLPSPRRVTHLQMRSRRGEQCSPATRPESAQGTAKTA